MTKKKPTVSIFIICGLSRNSGFFFAKKNPTITVCERSLWKTKVLWVLKFDKVGGLGALISISQYMGRSSFSRPKLHFLRGCVLLLVHFF